MNASNASTICTVLVRRGFLSKLGRVREANGKGIPLHLHRLSLLLSFTRVGLHFLVESCDFTKSAGKGRESKVKFTRGVGTAKYITAEHRGHKSLTALSVFQSFISP